MGPLIRRGEKALTPTLSVLLRKWPVLLRADCVLTKDPKWPYEGQFCDKIDRGRSCGKATGGPLQGRNQGFSKMGHFLSKECGGGGLVPPPNSEEELLKAVRDEVEIDQVRMAPPRPRCGHASSKQVAIHCQGLRSHCTMG